MTPVPPAISADLAQRAARLPWDAIPDPDFLVKSEANIVRPDLPGAVVVAQIALAIEDGRFSVRRIARELDITIDDLSDLLVAHGHAEIGL